MGANIKTKLTKISDLISSGDSSAALLAFKMISPDQLSYYQFTQFIKLFEAHRIPSGRKINLAIGGRVNLVHFIEALTFLLRIEGIDLQTYICEFNTIEIEAFNTSSGMHSFQPDFIWLFHSQYEFEEYSFRQEMVEEFKAHTEKILDQVKSSFKAQAIINNIDLPAVRRFGNFEALHPSSSKSVLSEINKTLLRFTDDAVIFDYDFLSSKYGKARWHSERFWLNGAYPFDHNAIPMVAHSAKQLLLSLIGLSKKICVVDLDNTLWPGIASEERITLSRGDPLATAYIRFQKYLKALKKKGILLAAVSKNDPATVHSVFQNVHGMILNESDFVSIIANWSTKAKNIQILSDQTRLPVSSMVFIDDSIFECNLVASLLPEISIIPVPEDPSLLVETVDQFCYFDIYRATEEDAKRTEFYRDNSNREKAKSLFADETSYLRSLKMKMSTKDLSPSNRARAMQLINKSNQYNLTGAKINDAEIESIEKSNTQVFRCYSLSDKFGDSGMISVVSGEVVANALDIKIWTMSCRVLLRGVENFVAQDLVELARTKNCDFILGQYVKTEKNQMAADHFKKLQFNYSEDKSRWVLNVNTFHPQTLIEKSADDR